MSRGSIPTMLSRWSNILFDSQWVGNLFKKVTVETSFLYTSRERKFFITRACACARVYTRLYKYGGYESYRYLCGGKAA